MHISIIIVNYNVKFFLEQCLYSVQKAIEQIQAEVFVVDNASTDGSIEFLKRKFPWVKFIINKNNVGFGRANNQALQVSSGEYVLFLNPDTLLPEDCLHKCLAFMEEHKDAGALGIRMIDGSGTFLPESKRSFPSPVTSFFKLIGLSSLFPKSKLFGRYALGYLDEHQNHEIDVLAGAFILGRTHLLQQLKGFDETFFMYGEDVDLSYRIQKAGYKNYYFSGSSIIHFKGESTKKGSLNYVRMFYQAMSIFVAKHYGGSKAKIFSFFIQIAIWLRAVFAAIMKFFGKIGLPLVDAILIFGTFEWVTYLWVQYVRDGSPFLPYLVNIALPAFTLVFLSTAALAGIYDNRYKPAKAAYAAMVATVIMLAVYALLPERYRFSRGVILISGFAALVFITMFRWLLLKWGVVEDTDETKKQHQTVVVGSETEYAAVQQLMAEVGLQDRLMGRIAVDDTKNDALGKLTELHPLLNSLQVREIIFCQGHLTFKKIIDLVQKLPGDIKVRFHARCSSSLVGSDSKDASGEFVALEAGFQLAHPYQKRMKRLIDIGVSLLIILTFPIQLIVRGTGIVANAFKVLTGKRTWVGYSQPHQILPKLSPSILSTTGYPANKNDHLDNDSLQKIDIWYARQYSWSNDIKTIFKNYKYLGAR